MRGETEPSRSFVVEKTPVDVKAVRQQYGLTQREFAALLGISVKTLRNWKQGRRVREGAARVLLKVAAKHPEVLMDVIGC